MTLHILYSFPHRIGRPGIGMTAWHQVMGLVERGVHVHLCCGSCERPIPGLAILTETMKRAGLRIPYRLLGDDNTYAWHDRIVARLLRRVHSQVDLVHCWPLGSYQTLRTAQACDIPTVLERPNAHTGFAYEAVAAEHKKIGLPVPPTNTHAYNARRLAREQAEYLLATRLACPSDFVMKTFTSRGFTREQIVRHRYGYDAADFVSEPSSPSVSLQASPTVNGAGHQFTAAFVGRCEPRKGLHYALEAWHRSGAAESGRFLIAGDFVPGYRELLAKLLDHPSIKLLGFVEDPGAIMRQSDILLLPSIEEGSALVTYEARACGCVLVVSDATGAHCVHMQEGLVHAAGDVVALTEHLRQLYHSPELLAQFRKQSLLGVPELTWNAAARQMIGLYEDLLEKVKAKERLNVAPGNGRTL